MKKIFAISIVLLFGVCLTFAADTGGDCKKVLTKDVLLSNRDTADESDLVKFNLNQSMPKKAMEKAFDNLKAYCCDTNQLSKESCDTQNSDTLYPESIYLFDHVLDVYLRRLDAREDGENGKNLLYNLEPDPIGKERREFITKHGNDVKGLIPLVVQQNYEKYWKKSDDIKVSSFMRTNGIIQDNWAAELTDAIQQYDIWTLYDKYNLACDISNYISANLLGFAGITNLAEYNSCKSLTNARITNEYSYTQAIMVTKADKLLGANLKAYMGTYFVSSKLSDVLQIMFNFSTSFAEVNRAVNKLTPQCS